jgi:hypothetical protein
MRHRPAAGLLALLLASIARCALGLGEWLSAAERALVCDREAHPFPPRSRQSVRWLHVPKTGTSFMNTVWHYGCTLPASASASEFRSMYEQQFARKYPREALCPRLLDHSPATHKPIGDAEFASHRGAFVTMLREPSARLVSAFKHGKHCIQDCHPETESLPRCVRVRDSRRLYKCKAVRRAKTPREYAALPEVRGCAAKMLLGRPCNDPLEPQANETQAAVERLRGFAFVGLVEEWDLSVCLFHRLLGGTPLPQEFIAVRVNKGSAAFLSRRPQLLGGLRDEADEALYGAARASFRQSVQQVLQQLRTRAA